VLGDLAERRIFDVRAAACPGNMDIDRGRPLPFP